jgi:23S rRNA-/tRNA-specific pseudouridylate synthase
VKRYGESCWATIWSIGVADAMAYIKRRAQRGLCLHNDHQQQVPWTDSALAFGKPLPHSTPQAWQQRLRNGEVTLNGDTATGSESVMSGQTLVRNRPAWIEPDCPQHFEILYEDPHLLAVNKPSGLPTVPGGGFMENTLLRLVRKRTPNANPVHRQGSKGGL